MQQHPKRERERRGGSFFSVLAVSAIDKMGSTGIQLGRIYIVERKKAKQGQAARKAGGTSIQCTSICFHVFMVWEKWTAKS